MHTGPIVAGPSPAGGRICSHCDRPITGPARESPLDSMSGARPSTWSHPDPRACRAPYEAPDAPGAGVVEDPGGLR